MDTIRLRTIEGRRMRDPKHPKRAVIATGAVFDVPINDVHWFRRLRDGDVEEVMRKAKIAKPGVVLFVAKGEKKAFAIGDVAEISALDDAWRLALDRGDAELVPDDEPKATPKPFSAPAPAAPANDANTAKE